MATTDNVQVSTATGVNGQQYTQAISNDKLTNEDFLNLMLEQMKQQDPTKPMDSQSMLDSQMQMSTIETNLDMSTSMKALQQSFAQMNLSTATNVIGKIVETDELGDDGLRRAYQIGSAETINGEIYVEGLEIITNEKGELTYANETTKIPYSSISRINYTPTSGSGGSTNPPDTTTGDDTTTVENNTGSSDTTTNS
ncbi:hypothetical protein LXN10_03150 [Arcobacter sp. KX21116]|uniref:flagellar hook assembly protein FlgD n=1 Tax=Arcobacter iocasae TaxID=2906515 RepID=UPI0035D4E703